jgi:UDP-glucose 4-epimerase
MRVLVTGGAGFIGSHITERLLADPRIEHVRVCDNLSTGNILNVANFAEYSERFEFHELDLLNDNARTAMMVGVDVVFHEAAIPSVPESITNPTGNHTNGGHLAMLVLESARQAGVGRLVYAASSSAYGCDPITPKTENMAARAYSPYAASKLAGEHYMEAFANCYDIDTVSLRYFNVFGPRQDAASTYSGVLARFCAAFRDNSPITIFGDGEQSRDFIYVDNVVQANILAAFSTKRIGGVPINIGTGISHTLNSVVKVLSDISGKDISPTYAPTRTGDIKNSLADISRAVEILGYSPTIAFKDGLRSTYDWYCR